MKSKRSTLRGDVVIDSRAGQGRLSAYFHVDEATYVHIYSCIFYV